MCGNPECKALPGNGDGNSINSFCDRACEKMGEGKTNFVSSLRLEVMGDVEGSFDSTINSNKESNNNTDKRESNFGGRNFSQKTTGKVSRQATSGRSMRS